MAQRCGVRVLRFSIGFGKPIFTRVAGKDRTEYCISALPLGGYVKFLDEREGPVDEADRARAFNNRPVPARIAVLLAGPFFNFIFAFFVYWILSMSGTPTFRPTVGEVQVESFAAAAGMRDTGVSAVIRPGASAWMRFRFTPARASWGEASRLNSWCRRLTR